MILWKKSDFGPKSRPESGQLLVEYGICVWVPSINVQKPHTVIHAESFWGQRPPTDIQTGAGKAPSAWKQKGKAYVGVQARKQPHHHMGLAPRRHHDLSVPIPSRDPHGMLSGDSKFLSFPAPRWVHEGILEKSPSFLCPH